MEKLTFVVEVVTDTSSGVDVENVRSRLAATVAGEGKFRAVHKTVKKVALEPQGLRVWAKRVANISLAKPKPPKKPRKAKAETTAPAEATA